MGNDSPRQHSTVFPCDLQTADALRVSFFHLYITTYITFSFKNKIYEFGLLLEPCKFYSFLSLNMTPPGRECFNSETIATQQKSSLNLVEKYFSSQLLCELFCCFLSYASAETFRFIVINFQVVISVQLQLILENSF